MENKNKKTSALIVYATNSGSTYMISRIIKKALGEKFSVKMKKAETVTSPDFKRSELIIFGSPSWSFGRKEGQPHESFFPLMKRLKQPDLKDKKVAIFSCGDSSYTKFGGAVDVLGDFVSENKGKLILESLRIDGFFFDQEKNTKKVLEWTSKLL